MCTTLLCLFFTAHLHALSSWILLLHLGCWLTLSFSHSHSLSLMPITSTHTHLQRQWNEMKENRIKLAICLLSLPSFNNMFLKLLSFFHPLIFAISLMLALSQLQLQDDSKIQLMLNDAYLFQMTINCPKKHDSIIMSRCCCHRSEKYIVVSENWWCFYWHWAP